MGTKQRPKPTRLADKLTQIRRHLGLSQNELVNQLAIEGGIFRSTISAFERGTREPAYPILLAYAKLAGISTDMLIDDAIDLNYFADKDKDKG